MKVKRCPECGSAVSLYMGGETGIQYQCNNCGYIGPLILESKILRIRVVPNARKDKIVEGKPLTIRVRAPAEKGKANKAVIKLLSKYFGKKVKIISGFRTRDKVVEIE